MKVILLGAPASGKGTVTKCIVDEFNATHISTGNILRENIKNGTELGIQAKKFMDEGKLVPDELILGIARERLMQDDCKDSFVLDGFPRTLKQAEALTVMLEEIGMELDGVVNLNVPTEVLFDRIIGRRSCTKCGATYNVNYIKPQVEGICDQCGSQLITRPDDTKEVFAKRLEEYENLTAPLVDYYRQQGMLKDMPYIQSNDELFKEIKKALGN